MTEFAHHRFHYNHSRNFLSRFRDLPVIQLFGSLFRTGHLSGSTSKESGKNSSAVTPISRDLQLNVSQLSATETVIVAPSTNSAPRTMITNPSLWVITVSQNKGRLQCACGSFNLERRTGSFRCRACGHHEKFDKITSKIVASMLGDTTH